MQPLRAKQMMAVLLLPIVSACTTATALTIRRDTVQSSAMGRPWPAVVLLPPSYETDVGRRFPVIYLLHGAGGDQWSWVRSSAIEQYLRSREVICVCPSGRAYGWYVDSPYVADSQLESFIAKELVPFVDSAYRTDARREARAICGFSMGGHGAMTLSAKHPDTFLSASSMAGIMDITRWPGEWRIADVLGPLEENRALWESSSAIGLADAFAGTAHDVRLLVDCGRGDFAYPENRDFHERLCSLGVEHEYREVDGEHNWKYWTARLETHLDFHLAQFDLVPERAE
jgi:putative tributyrin esterase